MTRTLAIGVLVASALLATPAAEGVTTPPRHTGIGVRLLDAPKKLANDPRARSYVIDHLAPGMTITRHVQVTNDTGGGVDVQMYADAAVIAGGSFVPAVGRTENELTRWTQVSPPMVHLQQGQAGVVTVTVRIPIDASAGERYGVIYAELPAKPAKQGFSIASRAGIRMYLDVGAGAAPASDFSVSTLTAARDASGRPEVLAQVANTGGRALDMTGKLWLSNGPGGLAAGPFAVALGTTLGVHQSEPVKVVLDKSLPAGPWRARLLLQSDLVKHAVEGVVTFPMANDAVAAPVRAKPVPLTRNRNLLVPIAVGLILALLVGLVLFLFWRRRRRDDEDEQSQSEHTTSVPGPRHAADERSRR